MAEPKIADESDEDADVESESDPSEQFQPDDHEDEIGTESDGPAQDLAEIPDDGDDVPDPSEESGDPDPDPDVDAADPFDGEDDIEVDLADTDVGDDTAADTPFTGDDDVDTPTGEPGASAGNDMSASDIQQGMESLGDTSQLDSAINEGFARLAVVGLDDGAEKDSLEMEFHEVFEMFRLGHFGAEAVNEYILTGPEEEVDPLWAFSVSLAMSTALVVYMRPDRDEIVASARDSLSRFTGGIPNVR